ncbi:methyltransferase domain-containing protein [Amycolatopsis sp. NPDC051061]|uniref:class I SAM-dependent methyltransferase n=1 Tax=Amycolatopsis sp. NPDC051061 TaxID=3155042 RepID=UPI0034312028
MAAPEGIAGVFDRAADTYDDVGVPWFRPIAAGLVEELAVQPGERVLDVGCGRGALLAPLAGAAGPTGRVLGVDLAPRMVSRTAEDFRDVPQVEVRVADAAAPGLPLSSFDVVGSSLVLFFLPDPAAAVRSWADLLVAGGRMGVTTFGPQDERWRKVDAVFTPYLPPEMLDARTSGSRGPFASDEGVERLLREGGLVEVRTAHRVVEAVFRDAEHLVAFSWSHGQRAMWEAVPVHEHPALRQQLLELAGGFGDESGRFSFTQHVRHTLGHRAPEGS